MPGKKSKALVVVTESKRPTTITVAPKKKGKKGKKKAMRHSLSMALSSPWNSQQRGMMDAYINTLTNPFEYGPVGLGWGCAMKTQFATAYVRGSFNSASDGNFALMATPSANTNGTDWAIHNGLVGTTTWNYLSSNSASTVNSVVGEARLVSGGIRLKSMAPCTAPAPILYGGLTIGVAQNYIQSSAPSTLIGLMSTDVILGNAQDGFDVLTRPMDPVSFQFTSAITGFTAGVIPYHPIPYACMENGASASYGVFVEVIYHFEYLPKITTSLGESISESVSWTDTIASLFPSMEAMLGYIGPLIGPAVKGAVGSYRAGKLRTGGRNYVGSDWMVV